MTLNTIKKKCLDTIKTLTNLQNQQQIKLGKIKSKLIKKKQRSTKTRKLSKVIKTVNPHKANRTPLALTH